MLLIGSDSHEHSIILTLSRWVVIHITHQIQRGKSSRMSALSDQMLITALVAARVIASRKWLCD